MKFYVRHVVNNSKNFVVKAKDEVHPIKWMYEFHKVRFYVCQIGNKSTKENENNKHVLCNETKSCMLR